MGFFAKIIPAGSHFSQNNGQGRPWQKGGVYPYQPKDSAKINFQLPDTLKTQICSARGMIYALVKIFQPVLAGLSAFSLIHFFHRCRYAYMHTPDERKTSSPDSTLCTFLCIEKVLPSGVCVDSDLGEPRS